MRRRAAWLAALLGILAALPAPAAAAAGAAPLTNEDVVRLVMTGTPEKEILAAIESRPADFALAPEMVAELRLAGVPEPILEAMRRRQAAMPARVAATPAPGRAGVVRLEFAADAGGGRRPPRAAIALKSLPRGVERRGGVEVGLMADMALAVLCASPEHVPDHWDQRSPLHGAVRHELLLFRPGSAVEKIKGHEVLYLDHQAAYEIEVPEGTHALVVAAAGKQSGSGTWRVLESDTAKVTVLPGRTTRVTLRANSQVKGSYMVGFTVQGEWTIAGVEILEPSSAAAAAASPAGEARP